MKKIIISTTRFLAIIGTCLLMNGAPQTTAENLRVQTVPTAKFALLVGINDYDDPTIRDLSGAANDVALMRGLLLDEPYKFDEKKGIRELVAAKDSKTPKPTKANIAAAFREHLIENARQFKEKNPSSDGAAILFYYSGHGSYVPDQETETDGKDEYSDGFDETIVPMDAVITSKQTDIRDDELRAWLDELKKYTSNITFVFDSCHSGTVTRGGNTKSIKGREFPDKKRAAGRVAESLNEIMDEEDGYVTISGSMANEQAQESELAVLPKTGEKPPNEANPSKQWNGYLTYFLVKELRDNRGVLLNDLMRAVSTGVLKLNKEQTPQIEGDSQRQFLGTRESRQKRSIPIRNIEKIGSETFITIEAGTIVGALEGGLVGIYKETAMDLKGEIDRIAVGKIVESFNFVSRVKITSTDISPKSKVVLATPFFTDRKRKVAMETIGSSAGAKALRELKAEIASDVFFEPVECPVKLDANRVTVEGRNDWNIAIVSGTYEQFKSGYPKWSQNKPPISDQTPVYFLVTPNGNPVYNFFVRMDDPDVKRKIREALTKYTRVENLLTLDNAVSNLSRQVELKLIRLKSFKLTGNEDKPCEAEQYTAAELKKMEENKTPIYPGDWFYLEISNNTGERLYPYLYNISTEGAVTLAYQPKTPSDYLPSGKSLPLFSPQTCIGRKVFQAEEPFGKETFLTIATSQPFNGQMLESEAVAVKERGAGRSALESLFDQTSTNMRSEIISIPFEGWAISRFEFEVFPKP